MKIAKNKVVSIHYTLTTDDKEEVDSSQGGEPLVFMFGVGQIIPGLENALAGKGKGDKVQVRVNPAEGYGERDDTLQRVVPKSAFKDFGQVSEGMQFQANTDEGPVVFTIVQMQGDNITVDGNHPLAGQHLNFDVNIVDVREATAEEVSHGHAHGPGGHQHG